MAVERKDQKEKPAGPDSLKTTRKSLPVLPFSPVSIRSGEILRTAEVVAGMSAELETLQKAMEAADIKETNDRVRCVHAFLRQWTLDLCAYANFVAAIDKQVHVERIIGVEEFATLQYTTAEPVFAFEKPYFSGAVNVSPTIIPKELDTPVIALRYVVCRARGKTYLVPVPKEDRAREDNQNPLLKDAPHLDFSFRNDERGIKMIDALGKMFDGNYERRLVETLCEILKSGVVEEYQQKMFPEFRPYPQPRLSSEKDREKVSIMSMLEALPKSTQEVLKKAGIPIIQLTSGCEQRCPGCAFGPKGKVTAQFYEGEIVHQFLPEYREGLNCGTIWYYASDPLEHDQYVEVVKTSVAAGLYPFTSTIAPHGREKEFFRLASFAQAHNELMEHVKGNWKMHPKLEYRLSIMPQSFMRGTVLAVAHQELFSTSPKEISNFTGSNLQFSGRDFKSGFFPQGRKVQSETSFDVNNLTGISCRRGVYITPEGGVAQILPTFITAASLQSKTGNMILPITPETDQILCQEDHDGLMPISEDSYGRHNREAFGMLQSPAKMYVRNADGEWEKREKAILEAEGPQYLSLLKGLEMHCYIDQKTWSGDSDIIPYIPEVENFEIPWDAFVDALIEDCVQDSSLAMIECFDEEAFKKHAGEVLPAEYVLRIVAGIRMSKYFLQQWGAPGTNAVKENMAAYVQETFPKRVFRDGEDEKFTERILSRMKFLSQRGRAILKSLALLGLLKKSSSSSRDISSPPISK